MSATAQGVTQRPILICVDQELPPELQLEAAELAVRENPDNAPRGTAEARPRLGVRRTSLESFGALLTGKKWSNGRRLTVKHLNGDPNVHARVERLAKQWEEFASIAFDFGNRPDAEIRILYANDGKSYSLVGTDALAKRKQQHEETVHLGWLTADTPEDVARRVVVHEFGHVLGLIHEHQQPSVTIHWDKPAVYRHYLNEGWSRAQVDANLFGQESVEGTQYDAYDRDSIMHYAIPAEFTTDRVAIAWNTALSDGDKRFIAQDVSQGDGCSADAGCGRSGATLAHRVGSWRRIRRTLGDRHEGADGRTHKPGAIAMTLVIGHESDQPAPHARPRDGRGALSSPARGRWPPGRGACRRWASLPHRRFRLERWRNGLPETSGSPSKHSNPEAPLGSVELLLSGTNAELYPRARATSRD